LLYTINIKKYKSLFIAILIINIALITVPFLLVKQGYVFFLGYKGSNVVTYSLLGVLVVTSIMQAQYQRKKLMQIAMMLTFEERLKHYDKLFTLRTYWYLASCIVTAIIILVTQDTYFFYYGFFDIAVAFLHYPRLALFKRELREENIVLV